MTISRVAAENVTPLWPQLEPMIARALRNAPTHTPEDVRKALLALSSHLFVAHDDGDVDAFIITQFSCYPQGVWLHVWLAGAKDDEPMDLHAFLAAADQWRKMHGCRGFQITGARTGWVKKFPDAQVEGVNLRWTFD